MSDDTVFYDVHGKIQYIAGRESVAEAFQRLRSENAALREIVEAVASWDERTYGPGSCQFCGMPRFNPGPVIHLAGCEIAKARAWLRKTAEEVEHE